MQVVLSLDDYAIVQEIKRYTGIRSTSDLFRASLRAFRRECDRAAGAPVNSPPPGTPATGTEG